MSTGLNRSSSKQSPAAERDHLKKALEAQQTKYDALINNLGEGLVVIDPNGNIAQVNAYACKALGFTEDELVGSWFPRAVVAIDSTGQPIDPLSRPITAALTEGKAISDYANFLCKDGSSIPVLLTVSPILIDNKPAGAIEVFRNLTKERQLDLAKEDFVSIASHQLRTPATGVKAILSMLEQGSFGPLNPEQQKYLELAIQSNDRQLDIIEDLLSVARADAGTMDLSLDYIDISRLVHDVGRQHQAKIEARGQTLTISLVDHVYAIVDGPKLQMVVDNLLSNARKYTPDGGELFLGVDRTAAQIIISVKDTGIGIAEDDLYKIFAKFSRIDNEFSAPAAGTGLGLYLAKQIILLHNGDIIVTSKPGEGSVFQILIPNTQSTK